MPGSGSARRPPAGRRPGAEPGPDLAPWGSRGRLRVELDELYPKIGVPGRLDQTAGRKVGKATFFLKKKLVFPIFLRKIEVLDSNAPRHRIDLVESFRTVVLRPS